MDFFKNAHTVRLRSHHDKYLVADDDEESVSQDRNGDSKNARWTVEFVDGIGSDTIIRLNSCYGKYLTASNTLKLLGATGKKVVQTLPERLDSSLEWEPLRQGMQVKLKALRYGNFLRANGGVHPWRNTVTHDIPHTTSHQDWLLWTVDVVQAQSASKSDPTLSPVVSRLESSSSLVHPLQKAEGRTIYFHIANANGEVDDEIDGDSFVFKGNGVEELTQSLRDETGIEDIVVCCRSPLNGNIYPLRLQLPPNNTTMHVIILKMSSKGELRDRLYYFRDVSKIQALPVNGLTSPEILHKKLGIV